MALPIHNFGSIMDGPSHPIYNFGAIINYGWTLPIYNFGAIINGLEMAPFPL
jgi:hypothetical protein